ncbi:MAG: diguanylate cyclase [Nitrospirota bacterium]
MNGKLLIVGETRGLLDPVARILEKERYTISMAHSLNMALKAVRDSGPQAIIHVVRSPRFECLRLCERLRKGKNSKDIPIIMIAGKETGKRELIECMEKGASDTLLRPFDKKELLSKIKHQIKVGFLYDEIKKDRKDLTALLDVTRAVSSTLDSKEILYIIVKKISEVINVARCSIVRIDPNSSYGLVVASHEDPAITDLKINLKKYPEIKKALQTKDTVLITDVWKDPIMMKVRKYLEKIRFDSIMIIPIIYREELIGTLMLRTSRTGSTFTEKEIRLCQVIANVAAGSLYNAHLYEMLQEEKTNLQKLAITDFLTGVYNHRYFSHRLGEELERVTRYKYPMSLIMVDIDHFKVINDTYGHTKGDMVLKEFAKALKRNIRKTDILARYGGEEFVILLPQTDRDGAIIEAERIRKTLKDHDYTIKGLKITISLGIATYPHKKIKTSNDLIGAADTAMYMAKEKGRNSTEIFS